MVGRIMNKKILYGLILLITLSLSLGVVSASDNFANENIGASLETPANDIQLDTSGANSAPEIQESERTNSNSDLLGAANEDVLGNNPITPNGTKFSHIRDAIAVCPDGGIIDLNGSTYTGTYNGNLQSKDKNITIQNGIIDGSKITNNAQIFYSGITLKNIHFKNFNYEIGGWQRTFAFSQSVLENVKFSNCSQDTYMGFFSSFNNVNATNMSFDGITSGTCVADIKKSTFKNVNFTNSRVTDNTTDYDTGQFTVMGDSTLINCNFINTSSQQHSGAICMGKGKNTVINSNFINCTAWVGGAIFAHGDFNENKKFTIENCTFINCSAKEEGGALGLSHNNMDVKNCTFINNTALKGAGIMIGGIYHPHAIDGDNTHGHNMTIDNCYFENNIASQEGGAVHISGDNNTVTNSQFYYNEAPEGGAVHITGDNASVKDSLFDDNFAHGGKGAAVYVKGNYSSIDNSHFTRHDAEMGTVYIEGNDFSCTDSEFCENTASHGGAGIYVEGNNSYIYNSKFVKNNASKHGGAIHSIGSHAKILNSKFIDNHAIPNEEDHEYGLGGAIFINGNNNEVSFSEFEYNTARNGSAIYNRGNGFVLNDDSFENNQAWSYLLNAYADPELSYYSKNNTVKVEIIHIAGDNLINAIHNDGSPNGIFFYNVTYEHSTGKKTTGPEEINPRDGVENSENGKWLYQDPREDLQIVYVDIVHNETGEVVYRNYDPNLLGYSVYGADGNKTGLYGNITVYLVGLNPGNYNVKAVHPEDFLYKEISNTTKFKINPVADLSIVKEVSNKTPNFGDTISWTLKVTNNGPNDATGVYVTDSLPAGLIYVGCDGNYNPLNGVWNIGDLAVGRSAVLNIRTIVNISNTTILNVATVNSSSNDPDKSNNVANNTTKANPVSDLVIVKEVSNKTPNFGDTIIWTLKVTNNGPNDATGVYVTDSLPAGLIYVGCDGNYNVNTRVWTIGDLAVGRSAVLNIRTIVNISNTTILNVATVNSSSFDPDKSNNVANNTTKANPVSDLVIVKEVSNKTPNFGDTIIWTLKVTNNGPNDATGVYVTDSLPAGLIYVGCDGNYNVNTRVWTIGDLAVGRSAVLNIRTIVNISNTTILNVATVDSSSYDPNKTNNVANNTTKSNPMADLAIVKEVSNPTPNFGDEITWTIIVTNNGPDTARDVYVVDKLPDGLIYQSSVSYGYYNPLTGVWTLGDLAYGESATLKINTLVNISNASILNVATVNSSTFDPDKSNNIANNTTNVNPAADLSVVKLVSNKTPNFGEDISWTIIVTNKGPDTARDVYVVDKLPSGLIYLGDDSKGAYEPLTGVWTIGDLAYGESATLVIVALVDISNASILNVATVNSSTFDPDKSNNVANNTTKSNPRADLSVVKVVSKSNPNYGDVISWTIVVYNHGPDAARDVYVVDKLPAGLIYLNHQSETGTFNPSTGLWTIGDLESGSIVSLVINTLVNVNNADILNVAVVNSSTPDPYRHNNKANDTAHVRSVADLSLYKAAVKIEDDHVTWEIVVTNLGPDTAVNTRVIDVLPEGLQFVSYYSTRGIFDPTTGVWTIGDVQNGEKVTLLIETIAVGTGLIINEARVESDTYDPDLTNNYDYDSVIVGDNPDESLLQSPKSAAELPATGNPLVMLLIVFIALGTATFRRRK